VSLIKTNRTTTGMAAMSARAKDAAAQAVPMGKRAGTTAVQGARQGAASAKEWAAPRVQDAVPRVQDAVQGAQEWAVPRVQDAVQGAREWAAPRLESAADAVTATVAPAVAEALTTTVAPKVSSALRSTASQVRPAGSSAKTGMRRLLDWRLLLGVGAVLAAAGTGAAVAMRRRYASATAAAEDAIEPDAQRDDGSAAEAEDHSQVNGQVTTPRS
jgi:hypothetical protein